MYRGFYFSGQKNEITTDNVQGCKRFTRLLLCSGACADLVINQTGFAAVDVTISHWSFMRVIKGENIVVHKFFLLTSPHIYI